MRTSLPFAFAAFIWASSISSAQIYAAPRPQVYEPSRLLQRAGINQKLGVQIPLDLSFKDESGREVELRKYFGKPVILALVYYQCPSLCNLVLNGIARSIKSLDLAPDQYQVVAVSFDPREIPSMAAAKKETYLQQLYPNNFRLHAAAAQAWHFLTGQETASKALADAVGFRYVYDEMTNQYAHGSAMMILTPDGRVARYFYGIEYPTRDVRLGLIEASQGKIATLTDQVLLYCFHYDPSTGKYALVIMNVLRLTALITLGSLVTFMIVMFRRDFPHRPHTERNRLMGVFSIFPARASTSAGEVDKLYAFLLIVGVGMTILIFLAVLVLAIKYRRRSVDDPAPSAIHGSLILEIAWSVIPLLVMLVMFGWGAKLYFQNYSPPPGNALDIYVTGKQWMWKVQHPTGQREINELHVPIGRAVKLILASEDVIHSFYIPAFRLKHDVVPGSYQTYWFIPTMPGRYHIFCAEYCGTNHSDMGGWVTVMRPAEFANWLAGSSGGSMSEQGEQLFQQYGCVTCHVNDSQGRCPSLLNVFGKSVVLDDGRAVIADEAYVRESILNPNAKIVKGYQRDIMPVFEGQIGEDGLLQLIAYIKSLSPPTPAPSGIQRSSK